jgi:hypothetical protein
MELDMKNESASLFDYYNLFYSDVSAYRKENIQSQIEEMEKGLYSDYVEKMAKIAAA